MLAKYSHKNGLGPRKSGNNGRPPKPRKDFPLTPHPSGRWCKKINKQVYYFGRWGNRVKGEMVRIEGDGWEDAKRLYDAQIDDLVAGRKPRITSLDQLEGRQPAADDGAIRL